MIFNIIFFLITTLLTALLSWLPGYGQTPLLLPYGIDPIVVSAAGYYNGIISTVPYLAVVFTCFGYILLFEIAFLVLKLFLGSRSPTNIN